jgi:molecular chaperone DnaK (HSP70)
VAVTADRRDLILGIDFGTSYTSAGALVGDKVELVYDNGDPLVPSLVHVPERGAPLIGRRAQQRLAAEPQRTVPSIKRILGARTGDPNVRRYEAAVGFDVVPTAAGGGDGLAARLGRTDYACEQLAGYILDHVRSLAEARFGVRVGKAVVTVSAAATPGYVAALKRAARIAHLEILQIVPEPVAGGVALGLHGSHAERRILICDFGGGTFDATLMTQAGLSFRAIASRGDAWLGGDDLDEALTQAVAGAVYKRASYDIMRDAVRRQQLQLRCESVKRVLSDAMEARLLMKEAYSEKGRWQDIDLLVERVWAEQRWAPLMNRAAGVVRDLTEEHGWAPETIDAVALIGGTSQVPAFRAAITAMLPAAPVITMPNAHLAVVLGATLCTGPWALSSRRIPVLDTQVSVAARAS